MNKIIVEKIIIKNTRIELSSRKELGKLRIELQKKYGNFGEDGSNKVTIIMNENLGFDFENHIETINTQYMDLVGKVKKSIKHENKFYIPKSEII